MARETEVLGEKPVTVPLCPPLMSRVLQRHRIRSSAASDRVEPWNGLASMGFLYSCIYQSHCAVSRSHGKLPHVCRPCIRTDFTTTNVRTCHYPKPRREEDEEKDEIDTVSTSETQNNFCEFSQRRARPFGSSWM